MLKKKSYVSTILPAELSNWTCTATLARARRPRWVDTLLIDSPSRTTQVEARDGPRHGRRESEFAPAAECMSKISHVKHASSTSLLPLASARRRAEPERFALHLTLAAPCAERRIDGPRGRAARIDS